MILLTAHCMMQLGGNTGCVDVLCVAYAAWLLSPCLCSASSGHQQEPQWLCHANAAISGGYGFSGICHLQIQEVKCSWIVWCVQPSHHGARDGERRHGVNKSCPWGRWPPVKCLQQANLALLSGESALLSHISWNPEEILLSGHSLQKKCQSAFSRYQ